MARFFAIFMIFSILVTMHLVLFAQEPQADGQKKGQTTEQSPREPEIKTERETPSGRADQGEIKRVTPVRGERQQARPQARPPIGERPEIVRPGGDRRPAGAGRPAGARRHRRIR